MFAVDLALGLCRCLLAVCPGDGIPVRIQGVGTPIDGAGTLFASEQPLTRVALVSHSISTADIAHVTFSAHARSSAVAFVSDYEDANMNRKEKSKVGVYLSDK